MNLPLRLRLAEFLPMEIQSLTPLPTGRAENFIISALRQGAEAGGGGVPESLMHEAKTQRIFRGAARE